MHGPQPLVNSVSMLGMPSPRFPPTDVSRLNRGGDAVVYLSLSLAAQQLHASAQLPDHHTHPHVQYYCW